MHLNVGWGIQALALSPFLPDRKRTVIDFYEVLSFLPDALFRARRTARAEQVRFAEEHFCPELRSHHPSVFRRDLGQARREVRPPWVHRLGDRVPAGARVQQAAPERRRDSPGLRRLHAGHDQSPTISTTAPFTKVVPHFTRGNLQLYVYNSPYVHGIGRERRAQGSDSQARPDEHPRLHAEEAR